MVKLRRTAAYVRRSTAKQETEHQRSSIGDFLERNDKQPGEVDVYEEQASGADADRNEFTALVEAIEAEEYDDVVVWEISRIARKGLLAQRFFDACEDANTTIHVTNGSVRKVEPDGHGRLVADIIAAVAAEERRSLIRRTKAGIRRAREQGKWVGQVPVGFVTVDGYLKPNLDPDYDDGEAGYFDVASALERLDDGDSYRSVAADTPNVTRQTLMNIDKDEDRRRWYLETEANDEQIAEALEEIGK